MNERAVRLAGELVSDADEAAREFERRLADSSRLAVRVAFSVLRNRADAEDVAQDAFVRAYRRFASLRDRDRFRGWLVRMTWRLALDWKRGHRRRGAREEALARAMPAFGDAERDAVDTDRAARLWAAIDRLPRRLRLVIVLAAIDGHGVRDVAQLLGVAEGTVKSRLFDARQRLRELLDGPRS
ncbi:MAG: sigma-70 family RNA polymerase sigma factor [Acidobacteria bacterium]|nr:sigma-70 family RNA polymerase sigma factor [Acidobacteriota bacterium]